MGMVQPTPRLRVNLDHVAGLRQARRSSQPDPVQAAVLAELGGAAGIAVHLRADRRHVQERDVEILRHVVKTELTLGMAATQELARFALTVLPDRVVLVPERSEEVTTEGGLDAILNAVQLKPMVGTLREGGIHVGLFVDPDLEQVKQVHKLGAQGIEINTAAYADGLDRGARESSLRTILDAARLAQKLGLAVSGGHSLSYQNVAWLAGQAEISELTIGHSIVARAALVGMERAVREMIRAFRHG